MKRLMTVFLLFAFCLSSQPALAGHGHYVNGAEGLRAASLPPPGVYYKLYTMYYSADTYRNKHGKSVGSFNVDVFAMAHRVIYSSDIEFLGGNLLFDAVVPMVNTNIRMGGAFDDERFGFGDILVEPFVLAWHGDRYDATVAAGVYLPSGYYSKNDMASPGKGYWSGLFTAGGTVYFDDLKTWHASILARYETHSEQQGANIRPGDDFRFEWGIGKMINNSFDLGVAGYCAWQVHADRGGRAAKDLEQVYAVGPEIAFPIPDWGMHISLRSLWEFENRSASEGNMTVLSLVKSF